MRKRVSLLMIIFTAVTFIIVAYLLVTELSIVKKEVISTIPDSDAINNVNRLFLLISMGALTIVFTFGIALLSVLRTPKAISVDAEPTKEEKNILEVEDKAEEEKAQYEEQIKLRVRQMDELVTGQTLKELGDKFLIALSKQFDIVQAILYTKIENNEFKLTSTYAYYSEENNIRTFKYGHGLPGQVAMNKSFLNLNNIPKKYLTIMSGLGKGSPKHLFLFPVLINDESFGVVELASFTYLDSQGEEIIRRVSELFAKKIQELSLTS